LVINSSNKDLLSKNDAFCQRKKEHDLSLVPSKTSKSKQGSPQPQQYKSLHHYNIMAQQIEFNLLPVHNGPEVYQWVSTSEDNRAGWNVESAINCVHVPNLHDRRVREWHTIIMGSYMRGFPESRDLWHAVCHRDWMFPIDRTLLPFFPDWVRDDHELWLELVTRYTHNVHLVGNSGPTLLESRAFVEALLLRRPEAVTYLPRHAFERHADLVEAVVSDWTRAREAVSRLYYGPNYNNLVDRILERHGNDTRTWTAFAQVSWSQYDERFDHLQQPEPVVEEPVVAAVDGDDDSDDSLFQDEEDEEEEVEAVAQEAPEDNTQLLLQEANEELRRRLAQVQALERRVEDMRRENMIMGNVIRRQDKRIRRMERQLSQEQEGDQRPGDNWNGMPNRKRRREY
jgi:hypothetical protein